MWIYWQSFTLESYQTLGVLQCLWEAFVLVLVLTWHTFFHLFIFNLLVPLYLKCVCYNKNIVGPWFFVCLFLSFFLIQFDNLCLLIWVFKPFISNVMINLIRLMYLATCFLFVLSVLCSPFLLFLRVCVLIEYFLWFQFISFVGLLAVFL